MRTNRASAPAPAASPAAGTHEIVAHSLARDRARGWAALVVCACIVVVAGWGALEVEHPAPLLAILGAVPLFAYGWEAISNVTEERRRVYGQEVQDNRDHNKDGFIGDPFNNVRVPGKGDTVDEVIIPKPSNSAKNQPCMIGWGISAADLVAFAFEVETSRGLQERAWVGKDVEKFILPSGQAITQKLLRSLQDALFKHGMASKPAGRWQMDWTAQRVAEYLAKNLK